MIVQRKPCFHELLIKARSRKQYKIFTRYYSYYPRPITFFVKILQRFLPEAFNKNCRFISSDELESQIRIDIEQTL